MKPIFATLIATALFAVGESVDTGSALLNTMISTMGPIGFMSWFCWYTLTKRDPATQQHYEGIVSKVVDGHERAVAAVVKELRDERASHREEVQRLATSVEQMVAQCHGRKVT